MKGVNHRILKVDLSTGLISTDEHPDAFYRKYLGGRGIALYYMLREQIWDCDPFARENLLIFAPGIPVGSATPAAPRFTVCAKSPLTGGLGEAEAGGFFGPELKRAGFDAVVIRGKADSPVYLSIREGEVELQEAGHLWGLETGPCQEKIRSELKDDRVRIAQIGPAGEQRVRYANIVNELAHFNGRTGLGAVMGAKNLKAVAVRGTERLPVDDKGLVQEVTRWAAGPGREHPLARDLHEVGTCLLVNKANALGGLPTRNWERGSFAGADLISGERMKETIGQDPGGCYACPIRCKRAVSVEREDFRVDPKYGGPEYETLAALGSTLMIDDLEVIARANELCNRYTLDTISTGMTIAFAMDCYEHGYLKPEDCEGLDLRFGDPDLLLTLIEKIATRSGVGDLLAEGSRRMSERLGPETEPLLREVKGQEIPMHDPRYKVGVALQYALADYGADHMKAAHDPFFAAEDSYGIRGCKALGIYEPQDPEGLDAAKVRLFKRLDLYWTLLDMLGICHFGYVPRGPIPIALMLQALQGVTGCDLSLLELMEAAERAVTMGRLFNIRAGFTTADDRLPAIFFSPLTDGPQAGGAAISEEEFSQALHLRYELMGWDMDGKPTRAKLIDLGLTEFA